MFRFQNLVAGALALGAVSSASATARAESPPVTAAVAKPIRAAVPAIGAGEVAAAGLGFLIIVLGAGVSRRPRTVAS